MGTRKAPVTPEQETQLEATTTPVQVWEGGNGLRVYRTIARTEAEALNNLCEMDPILLAIGCTVAPMEDIDGCPVVALVPSDYVFGDDRRGVTEAPEEAAEADILG